MSRFQVINSFGQDKTFILVGTLLEGELKPGMKIHIPLNSNLSVPGIINLVEQFQDKGYRLIIICEDIEEVEIWEMLNINDEIISIE